MTIWGIAGLLAGIGAILAGGTRPLTLSVALGPALLLRALGASMIGGLRSIWGSFAGGVGIGIVEALIIWNYPVGGVLEVVLAALIMVSMLVRPALGRAARRRQRRVVADGHDPPSGPGDHPRPACASLGGSRC